MGTYNSTMRFESARSSSDDNPSSKNNTKVRSITNMNLNISMHSRGVTVGCGTKTSNINMMSLMGQQAPPLYEAALVGNWNDLLKRLAIHPSEGTYRTAVHAHYFLRRSNRAEGLLMDGCK
jgi:hypothetical protein